MGKRKKLYQFRCGMAVILAVAMIFGMVPEVVYAMPETEQEAVDVNIEEPVGTTDSGSTETENPGEVGSEESEEPADTEDSGSIEAGEPGEAESEEPEEDSGNTEPEESGKEEDTGTTEPEDPAGTEQDPGKLEPEQPDDPVYDETEESLSGNALLQEAKAQIETGEDIIASGNGYNDNADLTWMIYKSGELVVEGTGEFTAYGQQPVWYEHREKIESATVRVTGATCAFGMFAGCTNLKTVDLKGLDTSSITNMYAMFSGCTSLTGIDLSGFRTESVSDMTGMFASCSALTTLDLSGFHTQQVDHMEYMFQNCCALKALDLSSFDTAQTKNFDRMFYGCTALETLDISGFIIQVGAEDMLLRCDSLREIKTQNRQIRSLHFRKPKGYIRGERRMGPKFRSFRYSQQR